MKCFEHLICPKCRSKLTSDGKTVVCRNGHSYDIAKEGYVNLLPPMSHVPGDNAEMVRARHLFLAKGYYEPLRDKLKEIISGLSPKVFVDAGCGEGYYTSKISESISGDTVGLDISKFAVKYAAKNDKNSVYAAANIHVLPFEDESVDVILSCFCAYDEKEYKRVLKSGGKFVLVLPYKRHLFGMKEILYDNPYENPSDIPVLCGFEHSATDIISYKIHLGNKDDISELYSMTPYQWNTSKDGAERLAAVPELDTEAEFAVYSFTKE